jgi:P-type conjugative transfer protein TrbJ
MMRKTLLAGATAAALLGAPQRSSAQLPVIDLTAIGKLIAQYTLQLEQYENQIQRLLYAIQNTINIAEAPWTLVAANIQGVRNITNQANILVNAANPLARLNSSAGYVPQLGTLAANWPQQLISWNQMVGNAYQTLGQTLQLQASQQASDVSILDALQGITPAGREQALEWAHRTAMAEAKELHEIGVTLTAAEQAQQTANVYKNDRQAIYDAEMQQFSTFTPYPTTGQGF